MRIYAEVHVTTSLKKEDEVKKKRLIRHLFPISGYQPVCICFRLEGRPHGLVL